MSIFGSIMSAIFGGGAKAESVPAGGATGAPSTAPSSTPPGGPIGQPVDVEAVVGGMAANKKEKLDWRKSIVDLMKVLDLD